VARHFEDGLSLFHSPEEAAASLYPARRLSVELWKWFLLAALGLMFGEAWLTRRETSPRVREERFREKTRRIHPSCRRDIWEPSSRGIMHALGGQLIVAELAAVGSGWQLKLTGWPWWVVLLLAVAGVWALVRLHRRELAALDARVRRRLLWLRAAALALLVLFLMEPSLTRTAHGASPAAGGCRH
jgi:hypothetical protein